MSGTQEPPGPREHARVLARYYPVEFPPDFFAMWDFCLACKPESPHRALGDGFILTGPFSVLASPERAAATKVPMLMHWRYYLDPPEFFTVATGGTDGHHWGYWFDAPGELEPRVCSYYTNDAYEITDCGQTLPEAVDEHLAAAEESLEEYVEDNPAEADHYTRELAALNDVRQRLRAHRWPATHQTPRVPNVPTFDGMGLVIPPSAVKDLLDAETLYTDADVGEGEKLLLHARRALSEGDLGLALQIARAIWTLSGSREWHQPAALVMADVYEALHRPALAEIARVQARYREIRSVDLLAQ